MSQVKNFLKYINGLPFPLTIQHYFPFDQTTTLLKDHELHSAESWDALRQFHPHFSIPENREEWLKASEAHIKKDGQDGGLVARAKDVVKLIDELGVTSVFSAGVGGAGLEYQIKKMKPNIHLTCSEFAPISVERLKHVFLEADSIILFDMKKDDWRVAVHTTNPKNQLTLLYRIDIDLSDQELFDMIRRMHEAGIENILIILCGRLTLRGLVNRLSQRFVWTLKGISYAFSGYLRTEKTFERAWQGLYVSKSLECAGLRSFLLKRNNN
jgi:hypothetical protein